MIRNKINLQNISVSELETLALELYQQTSRPDRTLPQILAKRWLKLQEKFTWNDKNVEKLLWVNDKLNLCLQQAESEAEEMEQMLKAKMGKGKSFVNDFEIEISLQPFILELGSDGYMQEPENNIYEVLNNSCAELKVSLSELQRKENIFLSKETNWADLLPGFQDFTGKKHYIGYVVHVLYEHCYWSMQDILKISEFWAEMHIKITHFSEKLYAGFVNVGHADFIDVKKPL